MFALIQSSGSVPVSIDVWKITVKLGAICLAHSLRIRLGIPSGPDAKPNELISGTTINTSKKKSRSRSGKLNGHI
jgi:hypothetical protein